MRSYLLTEHEREVLRRYAETGEKTVEIYLLKSRARKAIPRIRDDITFINILLDSTKRLEEKIDYFKCYLPTHCEHLQRGMYCLDECAIEGCTRQS